MLIGHFFTVLVLAASQSVAVEPPSLEQIWIAEGFADPEGAALAPDGSYFISNVAGGGSDKDGEGWISKLAADGQVLEARWAEGLDAPKGMVVRDDVLYVTDIDRVRTYDVRTGASQRDYEIEGAQFLNDATVWNGAVLVSDSRTGTIHHLGATGFDVWTQDSDLLAGVNGLLGDGDRLLVTTMSAGLLLEYRADGSYRTIAAGMTDADGVGVVPGGYLVSGWRGDIFFVADEGEVAQLLDSRADGVLQNDLSVFGDQIIVPNWRPGTVTAWRLNGLD